jgi:hypothetical protein
MKNVIDKARRGARSRPAEDNFMACERGVSFGYNNLVSDMRSLAIMRESNCPVVFDATHSVQLPGGQGTSSGGQREHVPVLARAAVAAGIAGLFMETHPNPARPCRTARTRAAGTHEGAAHHPGRDRPRRQEGRFPRVQLLRKKPASAACACAQRTCPGPRLEKFPISYLLETEKHECYR